MQLAARLPLLPLVCLGCLGPLVASTPARAEPRIGVLVLPSGRPEAASLNAWGRQVARSLARRLSGSVVTPHVPAREIDVDQTLARARQLETSGALDEAAASYDIALDVVMRSPQRLRDSARFVRSMVSRASIALARGERARAEELVERLLRYDPGFELLPAEKRPSMQAAVTRVRSKIGDPPPFSTDLVGDACRQGVDQLVVVRALAGQSAELHRLDRCRLGASRVVRVSTPAETAAASLEGGKAVSADDARGPARAGPRPIYKRAWFWVAVGAVVAAAVAGGVIAAYTTEEGVDVVPHW